jgi:hypothetical protein
MYFAVAMGKCRGNTKGNDEAMGKCRGNAKVLLRQWENAEVMQRVSKRQ